MTATVVSLGLGLALVSVAGTLALVWATKRAISAEQRAAQLEVALGATTIARQQAESKLQLAADDLAESMHRHDAVLAELRTDITSLEADLATCTTPAATRARVGRLLGLATPRARPAADRAGTRPPGVSLPAPAGAADEDH